MQFEFKGIVERKFPGQSQRRGDLTGQDTRPWEVVCFEL
jgi:hypothetical protein